MTAPEVEAMDDFWARTLSKIESMFGKIVYLASLRDDNSGRYGHFGLDQVYGEEAADRVLKACHERAFTEWLNFPLDEQRTDLESHLETIRNDRGTILVTWYRLTPYRNLPPVAAGPAERQLYISDLEIILELLRSEISFSATSFEDSA